jgi:acetolactate synthase I/II/III large subunit
MNETSFTDPNVARYVLRAIRDEGVEHVFLVPGFKIAPFLSQFNAAHVTPIVACHEAGAAYMADGYARATRNFGVAMGIGGPGVTNMVTAVAAAYSDRSPVLIVAGYIPFTSEGQGAFQDSSGTGVEDRELMAPMTAFAEVIPSNNLVGSFVRKAVKAMKGVENRPAFLSVPRDLQLEKNVETDYTPVKGVESPRILDAQAAAALPDLLSSSTRITILAGNGAVWSNAGDEIAAFASEYQIPVVTTLRGKGAIPEDHPLAMGVFGVGGTLWSNQVVMGSDTAGVPGSGAEVLIVLGATLSEHNTLEWAPAFMPSKALVRLDINPNNVIGKEYQQLFIMGDARTFMDWLTAHRADYDDALTSTVGARKSWLEAIRKTPKYETEQDQTSNAMPMHPARVIAELRKAAPKDTVVTVDSGGHTYFTGHHWTSYHPNEFMLLATTSPMGAAVPMAIGAQRARPTQPHCAIAGDGCMLMHGMEIHTAVRYQVPVVILVINNSALGNPYLAAQKQSDEAECLTEIPTVDFAAFAQSLGADGVVVEDPADLPAAFERAFAATGPFVVDARCDPNCPTPNTKLPKRD